MINNFLHKDIIKEKKYYSYKNLNKYIKIIWKIEFLTYKPHIFINRDLKKDMKLL